MKRLTQALLVVLTVGCSGSRDAGSSTIRGDGAPVLVPVDSVVVAETDSTTLGLPNSLAVMPSGDFFVGDAALPKVVHYGRDGKPRGVVGRRGSGPGEFRFPSWLTAVGDTTVLVGNASALQVLAFDARSGQLRWVRRFPAQTSSMYVADNRLYIGFAGGSKTGSLGVLELPLANGPTAAALPIAVNAVGPVPGLFSRVPMAASIFGTVEVAAFGDTIVSVYEVSNQLYLTRMSDGAIDSVAIPPGKRRGAQLDLFSAVTDDRATIIAAYLKSSIPFELARLSSGAFAYVAFDAVQDKRGIKGRHFLSVVDPKRRAGCADTQIPGSDDPPTRVAFSGDTLFTLSQEATAADSTTTVLRAYRIDTSGCNWRGGA